MRLSGEDYSKRLRSFSHFTLVLISEVQSISKNAAEKGLGITTNSELNEEQVIEKLIEIINANPKQSQPVLYEDALIIVCNAIEDGHYCDLYEILDKNVAMVFVDEEKHIDGIRDVINFLVQIGLDHGYQSNTEETTCDILKIVKGERYGVGEKCILLTYHLKNGEKEYQVIKVHFTNGIIDKLEFYHPYGPLQLVAEE